MQKPKGLFASSKRQRGRQAAEVVRTMGRVHGFDPRTVRQAARKAKRRYR